jgi:hypothetical protein
LTISSNVLTALNYVPYISAAVQQVEAANGSLPGATKKQIVLSSVQAAAKVGEALPEIHVQLISTLIDILCNVFNSTGVFSPKPPAPAAA